MLYRIVWYGMLNVAAMTMAAGGCSKEYWGTLELSDINKSQINWNPSFVTLAWPVILLPFFLGAYQLVSPGLSAISALVNKHKQCKHLWSYQFNNSRLLACVSGSLCCHCSCHCRMIQGHPLLSQSGSRPGITLLSLSQSLGINNAQSLRVSACSTLSHHHHHHSGSSLLSQSGFRPGITLL